jgi:SAM-dependent methyltransferase
MTALATPLQSPGEGPVLANLGCGPKGAGRLPAMFSSWRELRVDADTAARPDLVADLTDLSAMASGSVQGVWCSHCIEHLHRHEVPVALAEIRRILAPEGFACISTPDLQTVARFIAADQMDQPIYESASGPVCAHDVVFGFGPAVARGQTYMAHRCGFTPSSFTRALEEAHFGQFAVLRRPNVELVAVAHRSGWASAADRDRLIDRLGL